MLRHYAIEIELAIEAANSFGVSQNGKMSSQNVI